MAENKVTPKQQRFVDEYLVDLNATQAAIRAGYSKKTAEQQGFQLLKKTSVSKAIRDAIERRENRTQITQDAVLEDIERIKRHAMSEGFDAQGNKVMNNYPAALKAVELQCKHLGLVTDRVELTGKNGKDLVPKQKVLNLPKDATPAQWEALARGLGAIGDGEYAVE